LPHDEESKKAKTTKNWRVLPAEVNVIQLRKRRHTTMKFRILVTTVLLVIGWTLIAQSTFRSSEAGTHGDCAALENQMKGLDAARARLQKDLQKATGSDRQSLI